MYVYLTRISTAKKTLWYAGKKHSSEVDQTYFGSGKVVGIVRKKHGTEAFQTEVMGWANTLDELNQLEKDLIAWCRAEYGKRCVNSSDGGDGTTPEVARRVHARPSVKARHLAALARPDVKARHSASSKTLNACPEYKARQSAGIKTALAKPEIKVRQSAGVKAACARPEVKARKSAAAKAVNARPGFTARRIAKFKVTCAQPEVKARHSTSMKIRNADPDFKARQRAGLKATLSNPEVRARYSSAAIVSKKILTSASAPHREEWVKVLKPALKAAGVALPKTPHPVARAETWAAFVETARSLISPLKKAA